MISITGSTCLWQENGKMWWSKFHLLEVQCVEFVSSSFHKLQNFFNNPLMKLCARISNWKHLDPAQFLSSIFMSLHLCSLNLHCILQTKGGFLLNDARWTWLCKDFDELYEEIWKSKREKNWREWKFSDLNLFFFWKTIRVLVFIWCVNDDVNPN